MVRLKRLKKLKRLGGAQIYVGAYPSPRHGCASGRIRQGPPFVFKNTAT